MHHKQIRHLKKKENEFEVTPLLELSEKPVRRIYRCPTKVIGSDEEGRKIKSGETSGQPRISGDTSNTDNNKVVKLEESLPRFGPLYSVDQQSVQATKEKAWDHVLKNSPENNPSITKEIYLKSIRIVEQAAKVTYADKVSGMASNFRWMMIKDGCFFLQLVFLILGCSELLGYPENDPIFGKKHNKKDRRKWIEAMFFVGNQIPFVVLNQLMNQKFFQNILARGKWDMPPLGLSRKVLFELIVLPSLKRNQNYMMLIGPNYDLLHGLQNLLIGPGPPEHLSRDQYEEADDEIDLEANEDNDYERILSSAFDDDSDGTSPGDNVDKLRRFLSAIGLSSAMDNRRRIFPCATELKRAGINIKKLKNGGARSIDFRSYYFWAFLYLPAFPVDGNAEIIFRNLKIYEMSQQMAEHKREVSAYLRFMSDIIQSTKDVNLLRRKGIIQGNSDHIEKLPGILSRLMSSEDVRLTYEFHTLRRKIRDYSSPWVHYKGVINLVVFLTLLQTLFALLAYFRPPKP